MQRYFAEIVKATELPLIIYKEAGAAVFAGTINTAGTLMQGRP
jgi:dihydrodipicolinate synthase/N-acetylneuraminate lyase